MQGIISEIIKVNNVSKSYKDKLAVKNESFSISKGEVVVIFGLSMKELIQLTALTEMLKIETMPLILLRKKGGFSIIQPLFLFI